MVIVKSLFWISVLMIFYAYLGYPILLWIISGFKNSQRKTELKRFEPKVSLLISVYNEESVIEDKILNSLTLDYPKNLFEIVVISDGSNDRTHAIAAGYASKGVFLRHYEGRSGKTACLNKAVPLAKGDIIVFSDANSKYDKAAIKRLVNNFIDETIGFVTGTTKYISNDGERILDSIGVYSRIEQFTKRLESNIGSCVGADGAIFAIRKHLYRSLKDFDINDFVVPLNVIKQGFRGVFEEEAFCIEKTAKSTKGEFNRQVRITNRTIRAIVNNRKLFNPFEFGIFSFQLLSHKVCKLMVPFFMLLFFFTNLLLIRDSFLYIFILGIQVFVYLASMLKDLWQRSKGINRLISMFHTFTIINMAILWGWVKYLKGETYVTWTTTR